MLTMECPPGAGLWTLDSTWYQDAGSGQMLIASKHYHEALAAGWTLAAPEAAVERDLLDSSSNMDDVESHAHEAAPSPVNDVPSKSHNRSRRASDSNEAS